MRAVAIFVITAFAITSAGVTIASAIPADGAAIARLGQQLDVVLGVKTKKPKTKTSTPAQPPPRQPSSTY